MESEKIYDLSKTIWKVLLTVLCGVGGATAYVGGELLSVHLPDTWIQAYGREGIVTIYLIVIGIIRGLRNWSKHSEHPAAKWILKYFPV